MTGDRFTCEQLHCEMPVADCLFRQRLVWLVTRNRGRIPRDMGAITDHAPRAGQLGFPFCHTCPQGRAIMAEHPGWTIPPERIHAMYVRKREQNERRKQSDAIWWDKVAK